MNLKLPQPVLGYVDATNAGDAEKGASFFSENATVFDEGEVRRGRKSIREWFVR